MNEVKLLKLKNEIKKSKCENFEVYDFIDVKIEEVTISQFFFVIINFHPLLCNLMKKTNHVHHHHFLPKGKLC